MIGPWIRTNHERWARKYVRKVLSRPFFREVISDYHITKITDWYVRFNEVALSVAFFIALVLVFLRDFLPRMGFEKTVVLLLIILVFVMRRSLERSARGAF